MERENNKRLAYVKELLEKLLVLSENEQGISRDAEKLCSVITSKDEFAEVLQFAAQSVSIWRLIR